MTLDKLVNEILPGYTKFVFRDPATEQMAKTRLEHCVGCEHLNHIIKSKKYGKKCGMCGCPVLIKVRSESSKCPANKW